MPLVLNVALLKSSTSTGSLGNVDEKAVAVPDSSCWLALALRLLTWAVAGSVTQAASSGNRWRAVG